MLELVYRFPFPLPLFPYKNLLKMFDRYPQTRIMALTCLENLNGVGVSGSTDSWKGAEPKKAGSCLHAAAQEVVRA